MRSFFKGKMIYLLGAVFIVTLVGIIIYTILFGNAYKEGLDSFTNQNSSQEITSDKKKKIMRVTIKKEGETQCIKVTPDGIVRIYATCDEDLESVTRPSDPKNILNLLKILTEADLKKFQGGMTGNYYILTIETDTGTETIYVSSTSDIGDDIIQTIEDIKEDLSSPIPRVSAEASPFSSANPLFTPPASPLFSPLPSVLPSGEGSSQQVFSCEFDAQGNRKPFNISNIICSTEPTPVP